LMQDSCVYFLDDRAGHYIRQNSKFHQKFSLRVT